jgi:membrane-bound metal-dependent hydrolase YbcI (DUF457 family)
MIIEHILYNLSIAILIGIVYNKYTNRNPTWLIVAAAYLPDIDYILQSIWIMLGINPGLLTPYHGDFHNIVFVSLLIIIFAYIYKKYYNGLFIDGIICIGIGGFAHILEDIIVYDHNYYLLYPFSKLPFHTPNWIPETRNLVIGDSYIIFIGICCIIFALVFKFAIEGEYRFIHYIENHIKPLPSICISMITNALKL